ncbi:MAG: methyltransferase [Halieaceae bacterium]
MRAFIAVAIMLCAMQLQAAPDWKTALDGAQRSEENRARDSWRHPRQTLEFFGLREDMAVVEISPGGGWYTEVLAPLLHDKGTLYAANASLNPPHPYYRRSLGKYLSKLGDNNDVYGKVVVTQLQPPSELDAGPAGQVDLVLTFRNVHNWMNNKTDAAVLGAAYKALKPGGVLGIVEHRAKPGTSIEDMIKSGYVTQQYVIKLAQAAGFKFVEASEVNANPRDSSVHPKGVWTLPPRLRLGEQDRDKYLAIGESDRMTLKFVKPG